MSKIALLFFALISGVPLLLNGQDVHYSQFESTPVFYNPANVGFFSGTHRFSVIHRNQWASVTVPYISVSAGFDTQLKIRKFKRDIFGFGVIAFTDRAGDLGFGTTQMSVAFSYIKSVNRKNNHFISLGAEAGIAQKGFQPNDARFGNQYSGGSYNPYLDDNESFERTTFFYPDFALGLQWLLQPNTETIFHGGVAFRHFHEPNVSFLSNDETLSPSISIQGGVVQSISESVDFMPSVLYSYQKPYHELLIGSQFRFIRNNNTYFYSAIRSGIFLRASDAMIVMLGLDLGRMNLGFSYDFNISDLHPSSRYLGGYEISVQYILNKKKKKKASQVPCPIF